MHLFIKINKSVYLLPSFFPFIIFLHFFLMVAESFAKQNFTRAAEDAVNQQIQLYQLAQQTYTAASAYFDKADVALPVRKVVAPERVLPYY